MISPSVEQSSVLIMPTSGSIVKSAVPTILTRPTANAIEPSKVSKSKGASGKYYTGNELKAFLKNLGISHTGANKAGLVDRLVSYLKTNDPTLYAKLSSDVK